MRHFFKAHSDKFYKLQQDEMQAGSLYRFGWSPSPRYTVSQEISMSSLGQSRIQTGPGLAYKPESDPGMTAF